MISQRKETKRKTCDKQEQKGKTGKNKEKGKKGGGAMSNRNKTQKRITQSDSPKPELCESLEWICHWLYSNNLTSEGMP